MADFGKSNVTATVQEIVSQQVQSFLIQESVLMGTVSMYQAPMGMDTLKVPKSTGFTVGDKAQGVAGSTQTTTWATDDLVLDKEKFIAFGIEDRAREQSAVNLEAAAMERAGKALALQIDKDIVVALEAVSASAPDHKLAYSNTLTLGKADLLEAKALMGIQNINFSDCTIAVSPRSEVNLLAISDFVDASVYSGASGLQNGELGRLYGARVIRTNEVGDLKTLIYHPSHVGLAIQRQLKVETDRDILNLADRWAMHQLYGVKTMDAGLRGILLGTAV